MTDIGWNFEIENSSGNLTVSTIVKGNAGDKNKEFIFTVVLSDDTINGTYGDMEFTNGIATFTLKHNQSITAIGLANSITYTITESYVNGYSITVEDNTIGNPSISSDTTLENGDKQCYGSIITNATALINFINSSSIGVPTDATTEFGWMIPLFMMIGMGMAFFTIKRIKTARQRR